MEQTRDFQQKMVEYIMMMPVNKLPSNTPPDPKNLEIGNTIKCMIETGKLSNLRLNREGKVEYDIEEKRGPM